MNRKLLVLVICLVVLSSVASAQGLIDMEFHRSGTTLDVTTVGSGSFPWTKMLNTLAAQLTGPLPMILGVLGLAVAALAMFSGNGGAGTQKFVMLIFAVSTCLFAPTFISWVSDSASSACMTDIAGEERVVSSIGDTGVFNSQVVKK